MGYYTNYGLDITPIDYEVIKQLRNEVKDAWFAIGDDGMTEEANKWYDHEKDLREFSKKYPNHLFKLSGEGENNEDMWAKYFKNGKAQICQAVVTIAHYDENKLE